jgi:chromo domain-containing protein 1
MTERTIMKQTLRIDDDDSISINSTQESEADEGESYVVDRILAEQDDDEGNKYYLIQWDGYSLLASTWEPAENIEGQATLDDWTEEKMRVTRGLSKEFDVVAFENELERIRLAKEDRRERRKAKRERLGLATSTSEPEGEAPVSTVRKEDEEGSIRDEICDEESEEPIRRAGRKKALKSKPNISKDASDTENEALKSTIIAKVRRRTINLPNQNHIIDTSEDSLVEGEPKYGEAKATAREKRTQAINNRRARDVSGALDIPAILTTAKFQRD